MQQAIYGLLSLLLFGLSFSAGANSQGTDSKDNAKRIAAERQAGLEALTKTPPTPETIPGYAGTSVPQTGYTDTNLSNNDTLPRDPNIRAAEDMMTNLPSVVKIDPTKFPSAIAVQQNPRSVEALDRYLSGQYEGCRQTDGVNKVPVDVTCDRWLTSERKYCPLNREVEVKADVHYRCEEWEPNPEFTCTENTRVSCKKNSACSSYAKTREALQNRVDVEWIKTGKPTGDILVSTLKNDGTGQYGAEVPNRWAHSSYFSGDFYIYKYRMADLKSFDITGGSYRGCLRLMLNNHAQHGKILFMAGWTPAGGGNYWCHNPTASGRIPRIDLTPYFNTSPRYFSIHIFHRNNGGFPFQINYKILVGCCESERRTTCTQ